MVDIEAASFECRICQSCSKTNLIQSPCRCKGSLGLVYIRCLEDWLTASAKTSCELCSHKFELVRVRRYSLFESIRIWIPANRRAVYKGFYLVLATCAILSTLLYVWVRLMYHISDVTRKHREREAKREEISEQQYYPETTFDTSGNESFWFEGVLLLLYLALTVAFILAYGATCTLVNAQYTEWRRFWSQTWKVCLVLDQQSKLADKHGDDGFVEVDLNETVTPGSGESSTAKQSSNSQAEALPAVHADCNV